LKKECLMATKNPTLPAGADALESVNSAVPSAAPAAAAPAAPAASGETAAPALTAPERGGCYTLATDGSYTRNQD
jgi:hypothetical protein